MKKYVILLFLMNFINLQSQSYLYQNERTYVISAEAEIRMKPDQVYFYVGIELRGTTLAETKARVSKVINDVIAYSKSKGIELKNIQTTHISIIPNYDHRSEFNIVSNYTANSFQQNEEAIDGLALGMISVKSRVTLHFSLLE
ncbi:MAG: SIMPL domain-containing protein [Saprospiraceae bacterium]|nr:SIMPL domain-containing protein [Saprospiraceae bacterium]